MAMCGLCALLDAEHWTEGARFGGETLRRARVLRISLLNRMLDRQGLTVRDCGSGRLLVANHTGKTKVVEGIGQLWFAVDELGHKPFDPLDAQTIRALNAP